MSVVLASLSPAPCYVSTVDRPVLSPAAPGASRNSTRTRCATASAALVSSRLGGQGLAAAAPRGPHVRLLHFGCLYQFRNCWRCWRHRQQERAFGMQDARPRMVPKSYSGNSRPSRNARRSSTNLAPLRLNQRRREKASERNQRITQLGARAVPAEEGAHGRLCTRSRYRLPWNQPERQGPRKAAGWLRCSPASLVLLSWRLLFLLPGLSFGSVCRAQARAHLCAGTSVPNQASALR